MPEKKESKALKKAKPILLVANEPKETSKIDATKQDRTVNIRAWDNVQEGAEIWLECVGKFDVILNNGTDGKKIIGVEKGKVYAVLTYDGKIFKLTSTCRTG